MNKNSLFEKEIGFKDVFEALIENIFLITIVCLVGIILGFGYLQITPKSYLVTSLLQFEEKQDSLLGLSSGQLMSRGINHQEQSAIYKSRKNVVETINNLQLDLRIDGEYVFESSQEYFDGIKVGSVEKYLAFEINFQDKNFEIYKNDGPISKGKYNETINFSGSEIFISRTEGNDYDQGIAKFGKNNTGVVTRSLSSQIDLSSIGPTTYGKASLLMQVRTFTSSPDAYMKIIDELNRIFIGDSVKKNSLRARNSINFLDTRINDIETSLKISEKKLNDFKTKNLLFEQDNEGKVLQEQLIEFERQLNEFTLEEVEARVRFTESNQELRNISERKQIITNKIDEIRLSISKLPQIEQEFIDLARGVEINQGLLETLISKKLEYSILEASTISDILVIDKAYNARFVGPRMSSTLFMAFLASFFIGFIAALLRKFVYAKVMSPRSLYELFNSELLGVVPFQDNFDSKNLDSYNSLATNILFKLKKDESLICISGPLKGVGKTTIASNTAKALSELQKKVILVDCDFHRGDLHEIFNVDKIDIKRFEESYHNIENFKVSEHLYVLPRPSNCSKTALAFFSSDAFQKLINELRQNFDYIVFDTPPSLPLSDSLVLHSLSDLLALVVRQNQTLENEIIESVNQFKTVKPTDVHLILNAYEKPSGYYGYQKYDYYAYKYYYSKDSYDYSEKD